jgi:hypothetical protein
MKKGMETIFQLNSSVATKMNNIEDNINTEIPLIKGGLAVSEKIVDIQGKLNETFENIIPSVERLNTVTARLEERLNLIEKTMVSRTFDSVLIFLKEWLKKVSEFLN